MAQHDRLLPSGFPVLETKLSPPPAREGLVQRAALVDRLTGSSQLPVVALVAPAGYGKSTVLSQWAERDRRAFAWLSIDDRDNDPSVLLAYIAFALGGASSLGPEVAAALASPGPSVWTAAIPRLGAALATRRRPFVLVLEDVDRLTEPDSVEALVALASHLRAGSQFVLAGRSAGRLPLSRMLASGSAMLIDAPDLQFNDAEAGAVLRGNGVEVSADEVTSINRSTEGWPAGLYLTALSLKSRTKNGHGPIRAVPMADGLVGDYIRNEVLSGLTADELRFVLDAAALERLSGPLCDSVMQRTGSGASLSELARSNLLLIPLDDRHEWYRYHHLLRDHLLAELRRRDDVRVRTLRSRAAEWHESHADDETALEYAMLAGDFERAARLLPELAQRAYNSGRVGSLRRWFTAVDRDDLPRRHSDLAVVGAILFAALDDVGKAERWAQYLHSYPLDGRLGERPTAMVRFGRGFLGRSGAEQMHADIEAALAALGDDDQWIPDCLLALGAAEAALGDADRADDVLEATVSASRALGFAQATAALALAFRAGIAMARGNWEAAELFAREARTEVDAGHTREHVAGALVDAVSARVRINQGNFDAARQDLAHGHRLRPLLTSALPWISIRVRLDLAHAHLALADAPGARTVLAEVRDILVRRPRMGAMAEEAADIQRQVEMARGEVVGASTLTTAELRLLPLLTTHLSFREIGAKLFVSHNTVKTQAISIYRKLDATSRSEAIERAVRIGLLESVAPAQRFIPSG